MSRLAAILAILLLAACAADNSYPPPGTTQARFLADNTIEVVTSGYEPPAQVALVGPQGVLPAFQIDTTRGPAYAGSGTSVGLGVGAGGGGGGRFGFGGIGVGLPLGGGYAAAPVVSTAYIRLPDPASYRANWQNSQLQITFGVPPAARTVTMPAPSPPPAS